VPQGSTPDGPVLTLDLGGVALELARIPAGTFTMGSPEGEKFRVKENEYQHRVKFNRRSTPAAPR